MLAWLVLLIVGHMHTFGPRLVKLWEQIGVVGVTVLFVRWWFDTDHTRHGLSERAEELGQAAIGERGGLRGWLVWLMAVGYVPYFFWQLVFGPRRPTAGFALAVAMLGAWLGLKVLDVRINERDEQLVHQAAAKRALGERRRARMAAEPGVPGVPGADRSFEGDDSA